MLFRAIVLLASLGAVACGPSCDSEYGQHCPTESPGAGLVKCLSTQRETDAASISADCISWLDTMVACDAELDEFCKGNEGDAYLCLSAWTSEEKLGDACKATLPKKEAPPAPSKKKRSRASEKRRNYKKQKEEFAKHKEADALKESKKNGGDKKASNKASRKKQRREEKRKQKAKAEL